LFLSYDAGQLHLLQAQHAAHLFQREICIQQLSNLF
jgi:hypothetical protein